jgi:hypothetical protein
VDPVNEALQASQTASPFSGDKRPHPAVFALLLEHNAAIDYWRHGCLHLATDVILARAAREPGPSGEHVVPRHSMLTR